MSEELNTTGPSFGQRACGVSFNPGGLEEVNKIKEACANVVDILHTYRENTDDPEVKRMLSVAITDVQSGQMWSVKGVTWNV